MEKYEDFLKECLNLMLVLPTSCSITKHKDGFYFYLYSESEAVMFNVTFHKDDSLADMKAKYAGVKASCDCLMTEGYGDDRETA